MAIKKENEYRNDNLKKRESNLIKDTKDTQTASEKALQHSQSKLEDKPSVIRNTSRQNVPKPNPVSDSNSKLQLQYDQNKLISTEEQYQVTNKLQHQNPVSDSNSKLQLESNQSKLISTGEQFQTTNNVQSESTKSNNSKLQLQYDQNKLINSAEHHQTATKLEKQSTVFDNNQNLQPQNSSNKLISTQEQIKNTNTNTNLQKPNYSTSGNNAHKLQPQLETSKLVNTDGQANSSKLQKAKSSIAKNALTASSDTLKKGVEKYKQELERDDQGVQVVNRATETVTDVGKKTTKAIKNRKLKKPTSSQLEQSKSVLIEDVKQAELDIKESKAQVKRKLKKNTKQIDQAKKELKIKNNNLKEKKTDLKLVKKEQSKRNFIKKASKPPLTLVTNASKSGASKYKKQLESDDEGVEVTGKATSLVKQGSKALNRTNKIRNHQMNQEKLKGITTKLSQGEKKVTLKQGQKAKLKKGSKTQLKKKIVRRKMYAANRKRRTLSAISSSVGNGAKAVIQSIKNKMTLVALKSVVGKYLAVVPGALLVKLIPILVVFLTLFGVIAFFMSGGGGYQEQIKADIGNARNLSPEVERWRELVTTEAVAQGMQDYIGLILAIIQVESGGTGTRDIMQSSESAGYPRNYFQTEEESVRQGISYLRLIVEILQGYGNGYENNAKLIAQSYNFGAPFARYVGNRGGEYDLETAETYSRTVVAPSLGNHTGKTYPYVNEVSLRLGKPYLYRNGGNFLYGELVGQYIGHSGVYDGDFAIIMEELLKYEGTPYVWGGKTPQSGFDCSGLVAWGLKQIGITLNSPASSQYKNTVPIDESEARPGDLIFFKGTYGGPNHVSHVGFYIDENTMYNANGSGVGYTNWKSSYWQQHYAGIRRVVH